MSIDKDCVFPELLPLSTVVFSYELNLIIIKSLEWEKVYILQ